MERQSALRSLLPALLLFSCSSCRSTCDEETPQAATPESAGELTIESRPPIEVLGRLIGPGKFRIEGNGRLIRAVEIVVFDDLDGDLRIDEGESSHLLMSAALATPSPHLVGPVLAVPEGLSSPRIEARITTTEGVITMRGDWSGLTQDE